MISYKTQDRLFAAACITVCVAVIGMFVLTVAQPHYVGIHAWEWQGRDDANFQADYGESRSRSLLGGFLSPDVDYETLQSLMRGKGWTMACEVCDEPRWN